MSSAKQDKSIPAQRDELVQYAETHGYTIVGEYADSAISGDNTEKRDQFLKLREDAGSGTFDVVLTWDQDRLSRNDPLELGYWLKPIRDAGVRLETVVGGPVDWDSFAGRVVYLIQQEAKHAYLRDLSRNVARGQLAAANNGRTGTGGRNPSGYKQDGDRVRIDPKRAAVIRKIFEEYAKPEASLRSVVDTLNTEGVKTVRGNKYAMSAVRDVLTNAKYTGAYVRFRYRDGKYHAIEGGEIVSRSKADRREVVSDPVVFQNNHEPIVSEELFEQVQRKLKRQKTRTAARSRRQYPLSGLVRCGDCGGPMGGNRSHNGSGEQRYRYVCRTFHAKGKSACYCNSIAEEPLLRCVVGMIQREYLGAEAVDRLRQQIRKQQRADRRMPRVDQKELRKRIRDLDQQIDQGAERVFSAPDAIVQKLYAKLERLREERDRAQDQLTASETPQSGRDKKDEAEVEEALQTLTDLHTAIDNADPADLRDLLAGVVSRIELRYSHDTSGKKTKNTFEHGTIFVRPPAGASLLIGTSESSRAPARPSRRPMPGH